MGVRGLAASQPRTNRCSRSTGRVSRRPVISQLGRGRPGLGNGSSCPLLLDGDLALEVSAHACSTKAPGDREDPSEQRSREDRAQEHHHDRNGGHVKHEEVEAHGLCVLRPQDDEGHRDDKPADEFQLTLDSVILGPPWRTGSLGRRWHGGGIAPRSGCVWTRPAS